jgi:FkbM family methyltransferase
MEQFQYLEGEKDVALLDFAQKYKPKDKCNWFGIIDHIFRYYNKDTKRNAIDIGANYGFVTCGLAQNFQKVYSFEINPKLSKCLINNTSCYGNVTVYTFGLSNNENEVLLQDHSSSGMVKINNEGGTIKSNVKTLDSLNIEDVDLIKIDVEGHEYEVILGGIQTITKYKPLLFFEWETTRSIQDEERRQHIFNLLFSIGYKFRDHSHRDWVFTT